MTAEATGSGRASGRSRPPTGSARSSRGLGRPARAALVLAVLRGLLMDLRATGDTTRTDRAFAELLTIVSAES